MTFSFTSQHYTIALILVVAILSYLSVQQKNKNTEQYRHLRRRDIFDTVKEKINSVLNYIKDQFNKIVLPYLDNFFSILVGQITKQVKPEILCNIIKEKGRPGLVNLIRNNSARWLSLPAVNNLWTKVKALKEKVIAKLTQFYNYVINKIETTSVISDLGLVGTVKGEFNKLFKKVQDPIMNNVTLTETVDVDGVKKVYIRMSIVDSVVNVLDDFLGKHLKCGEVVPVIEISFTPELEPELPISTADDISFGDLDF
jgi:hypothetical protein